MLIFTMVIPRVSGWVFSYFTRRVEISERNSELLRAELSVNIQLVFMTGLCRCYFFSSLLKKGVYFQLSGNNVMWLTSVIIPCASQPCRKGRIGKSCLSKLQKNQVEILSLSKQGDPEQLCKSPLRCGRDLCALGVFLNKNAARCNLKPHDKFWPELGICSAAEALKLPISHN